MALALPVAAALAGIAAMLLASGAWLDGWPHFARRILAWRTASD